MDREMETQSKRFWSVIITKIEVAAWKFTVHGYLILMTTMIKGQETLYDLHYLTPPDKPFEMQLPPWAFEGRSMDSISAKDVTKKLIALLDDHNFEVIPPAPLDIPYHKIPPSKRKTIAAKQRQMEQSRPIPPEKRL